MVNSYIYDGPDQSMVGTIFFHTPLNNAKEIVLWTDPYIDLDKPGSSWLGSIEEFERHFKPI